MRYILRQGHDLHSPLGAYTSEVSGFACAWRNVWPMRRWFHVEVWTFVEGLLAYGRVDELHPAMSADTIPEG